jgi:hypothetical protein
MLTWGDFSQQRPDLASAGQAILYQFGGVGLAFLGTVRRDGAPRVHPIAPLLHAGGLYGFLVPSPKLADLRRDARYALHTYPRPNDEDAFYLTGQVRFIVDPAARAGLCAAYTAERPALALALEEQTIVEFLIHSCLLTRTTGHGDPNPHHTIWRAPR